MPHDEQLLQKGIAVVNVPAKALPPRIERRVMDFGNCMITLQRKYLFSAMLNIKTVLFNACKHPVAPYLIKG